MLRRLRDFVLPHIDGSVRRFADCVWGTRVSDANSFLQSVHGNIDANRFDDDGVCGKQSVGQAYNPYTGSYGATHQGSSPTAQWGSSYVSQGNKSATTQHYSNANGTVASGQGSQGGKAYASSTAHGNSYAGKNSSGDMYAGHDGNVYKNTGSGWQKSNGSGGWSDVNTKQEDKSNYEQSHPNSQATAQSDKSSYEQSHPNSQAKAQSDKQSFNQDKSSGSFSSQNLDKDKQNRQSGSTQSQHFQNGNHSFGGFGGGGRSWGGGGRGGFRR